MDKKNNNYTPELITKTLEVNYMPYAMSVIISRALPEIDGFKPSHRKILYTMYLMNLVKGARTKSANVVGQTMKLNPHGDQAIYETLVRLSVGNGSLLVPFIDSKGNFGKVYSRDMQYAAARYTEVKLSEICNEVFKDIDKNSVDFIDNYDGTMREPLLLPVTFPNILVNPNQGIAVGMASNIPGFNINEVCEATIELLEKEDCNIHSFIKAPDFPTGGVIIYGQSAMESILNTGRGTFRVRSKYRFDQVAGCVEIYEIPYTTTVEAIIDRIAEIAKAGQLKELTDIRDETDIAGLKITIDVKKNIDVDKFMQKLFKLTPLEDSFSCNFNVLVGSTPKVMGVKEILNEWINFRMVSIRRQIQFDINKKTDRLHLLFGLKKIILDIDSAIKIIRETEKDSLVIPNLMAGFDIDKIQAEFVAEIKLRNLNKEYLLSKIAEAEDLIKDIENLKKDYESDKRVKKIIVAQLKGVINKFGSSRKSDILDNVNVEPMLDTHFIEDYKVRLFLTDHGYIKKIPIISLRTDPEQKMKEDDVIIHQFDANNKSDLILFSDKSNAYKIKIYSIEDCRASSLGYFIQNHVELEANEKILYMVATVNYDGFMLFCFKDGKMTKTPLKNYDTKTNRKKLINAYSGKDEIAAIKFLQEDKDIVLHSDAGKTLVVNTAVITPVATRHSQGIKVFKLKQKTFVDSVKDLGEVKIENPDYYRPKAIPGSGNYLRATDSLGKDCVALF